jgi:hypothetical protein
MKRGNNVIIKLNIANIIIQIESKFALESFSKKEQEDRLKQRFQNFFYQGRKKADIRIKLEVVAKLPKINQAESVFINRHFLDGKENWRLLKKDNRYIYKSPLDGKKQLMLADRALKRINAYILPKKNKGYVWRIEDIIYDFLQVLLINYFARYNKGIFVHGMGVKDLNGRGLLFAGKSGSGKTTTAKLWYRHTKAMILNDDRIIVRKLKNKFFIYGSPWHGAFSDYLDSRIEAAPLKKLFFIYHAPKNRLRRVSQKEGFKLLYPVFFPAFWDKENLENTVSFCQDLLQHVNCYSLGFTKDKKVINFIRRAA